MILNNLKIETFKEDYSTNFRSLNLEWIEEYFEVESEDLKILNDPKGYVIDKGGQIFFAIKDDSIIGTSAMIPIKQGVFELAKMAVNKTFQGQGIGRLLMSASLNFAKDNNASDVFLITNDKLLPAMELYKSSGFIVDKNYDDNRYRRGNTKLKLRLN